MGWLENWKKSDITVLSLPEGSIDLSELTVFIPSSAQRLKFYGQILLQEVYKRSRAEWKLEEIDFGDDNQQQQQVVSYSEIAFERQCNVVMINVDTEVLGEVQEEGYKINFSLNRSDAGTSDKTFVVTKIIAATDRGALFGVGRFLRELHLDFHISYTQALQRLCYSEIQAYMPKGSTEYNIISRPDFGMRQHQVAYRPKTNSYDAFTKEMMQQEIVDLALFGTNGIEMIPPGIDDALQSPNFNIPWLEMMKFVSQVCHNLDIRVSIWYPAFFKSYNSAEELAAAEGHWDMVFSSLQRLDSLFVPGGDPGGRAAEEFFDIVEKQTKFLRSKYFPECEVWVSSQFGLSTSVDLGLQPWVPIVKEQKWLEMLGTEKVLSFLTGVVYGPWSCIPIQEFRAQVPEALPVRNYPDLCHVQTCQLPVTSWDLSFALTNNRESINPRPLEFANIILEQKNFTIGCGCYSEGVNDDINKYVWTGLHWGGDVQGPIAEIHHFEGSKTAGHVEPGFHHSCDEIECNQAVLKAILRQYSAILLEQARCSELVVEAILALEQNWFGDLIVTKNVEKSIKAFALFMSNLDVRHKRNWRLNLLMFRLNHDCMIYTRLFQETDAANKSLFTIIDTCLGESVPLMQTGELLPVATLLNSAQSKIHIPYHEPLITVSSFMSESTPDPLNVVSLSSKPTVTHLYARLNALAATLFQQVGYQLSVGYGSQHRQRGGYLDLIWTPLGDAMFIDRIFNLLKSVHVVSDVDNFSTNDKASLDRFVTPLVEYMHSRSEVLYATDETPSGQALNYFYSLYAYFNDSFEVYSPSSFGKQGSNAWKRGINRNSTSSSAFVRVAEVLWYASFGDSASHPVVGLNCNIAHPESPQHLQFQRIPLDLVIPPYRSLEFGEDAICFQRPLIEYLDCSNDEIVKNLHSGMIPRAYCSYSVPIWPRTATYSLQFGISQLFPDYSKASELGTDDVLVRITYLGQDLNRHGGDWQELGRESMATRLKANGQTVHGYLHAKDLPLTKPRTFLIPHKAIEKAFKSGTLTLTFEPLLVDKVTFRHVPHPVCELWLLRKQNYSKSNL